MRVRYKWAIVNIRELLENRHYSQDFLEKLRRRYFTISRDHEDPFLAEIQNLFGTIQTDRLLSEDQIRGLIAGLRKSYQRNAANPYSQYRMDKIKRISDEVFGFGFSQLVLSGSVFYTDDDLCAISTLLKEYSADSRGDTIRPLLISSAMSWLKHFKLDTAVHYNTIICTMQSLRGNYYGDNSTDLAVSIDPQSPFFKLIQETENIEQKVDLICLWHILHVYSESALYQYLIAGDDNGQRWKSVFTNALVAFRNHLAEGDPKDILRVFPAKTEIIGANRYITWKSLEISFRQEVNPSVVDCSWVLDVLGADAFNAIPPKALEYISTGISVFRDSSHRDETLEKMLALFHRDPAALRRLNIFLNIGIDSAKRERISHITPNSLNPYSQVFISGLEEPGLTEEELVAWKNAIWRLSPKTTFRAEDYMDEFGVEYMNTNQCYVEQGVLFHEDLVNFRNKINIITHMNQTMSHYIDAVPYARFIIKRKLQFVYGLCLDYNIQSIEEFDLIFSELVEENRLTFEVQREERVQYRVPRQRHGHFAGEREAHLVRLRLNPPPRYEAQHRHDRGRVGVHDVIRVDNLPALKSTYFKNNRYQRFDLAKNTMEILTGKQVDLELSAFMEKQSNEVLSILPGLVDVLIQSRSPFLVRHFFDHPSIRKYFKSAIKKDPTIKTWFVHIADSIVAAKKPGDQRGFIQWMYRPDSSEMMDTWRQEPAGSTVPRSERITKLVMNNSAVRQSLIRSADKVPLIKTWFIATVYKLALTDPAVKAWYAQEQNNPQSFIYAWERIPGPVEEKDRQAFIKDVDTEVVDEWREVILSPGDLTWRQLFDIADGVEFCLEQKIIKTIDFSLSSPLLDSPSQKFRHITAREVLRLVWCAVHDTKSLVDGYHAGEDKLTQRLCLEMLIQLGQNQSAYPSANQAFLISCLNGIIERMLDTLNENHVLFSNKNTGVNLSTTEASELLRTTFAKLAFEHCKEQDKPEFEITLALWETLRAKTLESIHEDYKKEGLILTKPSISLLNKTATEFSDPNTCIIEVMTFSDEQLAELNNKTKLRLL